MRSSNTLMKKKRTLTKKRMTTSNGNTGRNKSCLRKKGHIGRNVQREEAGNIFFSLVYAIHPLAEPNQFYPLELYVFWLNP